MGAELGLALGGAAAGLAGTGLGIESNKKAAKRQYENQRKLNEQGAELALQMWKDTNYEAQVGELEKAGLNKGLIYGMSGGGATTASTGSGGSAQAQQGGDFGNSIAMGINAAQLKLMDAQAENLNADTENKRGADRENKNASTGLIKMQTANQEIVNNKENATFDEQVAGIKANMDKAQSEARTALVGANVAEETQKAQEEQIKNEAIASALEAGLKQSQINVNKEQIKNWAEQIAIGKFNANQEAEFKGMDKVAGSQINKLINKIYDIFGVKEETQTQNKIK